MGKVTGLGYEMEVEPNLAVCQRRVAILGRAVHHAIMDLQDEGKTIEMISFVFGVSPRTVHRWVKEFGPGKQA